VFQADDIAIQIVPGTSPYTPLTANDPPVNDPVNDPGSRGLPEPPAPATPPDSSAATASASIAPGPASPEPSLRFSTTRPGPVRIDVYDVTGRRVRRLLDAPFMAPGLHSVMLEGRDDQGRRLGSGVYFYRVQAMERSITGRFVITR